MAKKSTTKVYGFKATPMREQFKRERELLMRQIRRYEKKGYGFESSVKAMVPEKERAGQRITKKYLESLRSLRASIADYALRTTDDGKLLARTAREDTHYRRGEHAQAVKRQKAHERKERELRRQLKEGLRNEKPVLDADGKPMPIEAQYAAADREAGLIPPGEEPEPEPEPYAQSGPEYEHPELPDIAHVIVNNFLSMFEEYAKSPDAVGAKMMVDAIEQMVAEHGYRATAKVLDSNLSMYPINDVAYSAQLANAVITSMLRDITGEGLDDFESDGGYWPGDELYE